MRFVPSIRYGTERYPEAVARRLRAVNITAWLVAVALALFAIKRPTDPDRLTILTAICVASVPLLHRFGPVAAPLALILLIYVQACRIVITVGTGDAVWLVYLTSAPLSILVFGIDRTWLTAALGVLATGIAITLNVTAPHATGDLPESALRVNFALNFATNISIQFIVVLYALRQAALAEAKADREYQRSETLLRNILPPAVAQRLEDRVGEDIADSYEEASVLFLDMAGFTLLASQTTPAQLVRFLNGVYSRLDELVAQCGLEKIKTSGDAYMVVGGVPEPLPDHAHRLADFALQVRDTLATMVDPMGRALQVRIGIASGPVVAGVVGIRKFFYDVWGDSVNTASRMETTGEIGKIQVAPGTHQLLADCFEFEPRGVIDVRGKGSMPTWFLVGRTQSVSSAKGASSAVQD
jgi:adenylate cyclase